MIYRNSSNGSIIWEMVLVYLAEMAEHGDKAKALERAEATGDALLEARDKVRDPFTSFSRRDRYGYGRW